ncbi:hypothetical protein QTP88_004572 [Uroleucon formosanum]
MSLFHKRCYQYCGSGTNLKKWLARGDKDINLLDSACRDHGIAYEQSNYIADRNKADYILEQRARDRFKSKDSGLKEKAVAWGVTTAMKAKRKIGGGCGFKTAIKAAKNIMKKNIVERNLTKLTKKCVAVARKTFKIKKTKVPRIITIPKKGGVLRLIPIFAGLSALGALTGGVANVVKVANEFNRNAPSHLGKGLYITPYKAFKLNFSRSLNVHNIRQYPSLTGYFRRYVKWYSQITKPLTLLLHKEAKWKWTEEHEVAFEKLKYILTNKPVLKLYDPLAKTKVHCNAFQVGLGVILLQTEKQALMHPVAYASRQTTTEEMRYHSTELETLAVVWFLQKFRNYLIGKKFEIVTDCSAVKWTFSKKSIIPRIARCWLQIMDFDF